MHEANRSFAVVMGMRRSGKLDYSVSLAHAASITVSPLLLRLFSKNVRTFQFQVQWNPNLLLHFPEQTLAMLISISIQ